MANGLPYGFKAKAERLSERLRSELNKSASDPLSAEELAKKLDIHILTLQDLELSGIQIAKIRKSLYSFSACTLSNCQEKKLIVHNEFHSNGRQQSNLMHEMAHILCEHPLPEPRILNGYPFPIRDYNQSHEKEAETLGGILQVTRKGLLWGLENGMSKEEMADYFLATQQMIKFRLDKSGVKRQMMNRQRYKKY